MEKKFIVSANGNLHQLGLGTRCFNALFRAGIVTVGQLACLDLTQLEKIRGLGRTSVLKIYLRLAECTIV